MGAQKTGKFIAQQRKASGLTQAELAQKLYITDKTVGITALGLFGIIVLILLYLLITDGSVVAYSVGSITAGLVAWGAPIWQMTIAKAPKTVVPVIISFGTALTSLTIQFFQLAQNVNTGDFAAVEDTANALCSVVIIFCIITMLLNLLMLRCSKKSK
ncbi:MAG: hypothetical protein IKJ88_01660 [Clostridia bacterium]|nr:hypothetical protein [Clostridia bacterium]